MTTNAETPSTSDKAALPTIALGTNSHGTDSGDPGPLDHLTAARRTALEAVLPKYLQAQRWFGGKARSVERVTVDDWGKLPGHCGAIWTVLDVRFADSGSHRYLLPLTISTGAAAELILERSRSSAVALVHQGGGPSGERALLHDALACDHVCAALLNAIGNEQATATEHGEIWGLSTEVFADLRGDANRPPPAPHLGPATSSNSLVFYGKRMLLKLFRRSTEGVNPDFEIGRFLTERGEIRRVPRMAGALEYHRDGEEPTTLAIVQETMTHRGDGWEHAMEVLGRYYKLAEARPSGSEVPESDLRSLVELSELSPTPLAREAIGGYLHVAAILGRQTAELHTALAADFVDPAFAPEPLGPDDIEHLRNEVARQEEQALVQLRAALADFDGPTSEAARKLVNDKAGYDVRLDGDAKNRPAYSVSEDGGRPPQTDHAAIEALKIRCHGDYHLGQVLWSGHDFLILDFEGEPSRSAAERKAKQSPLKDVAGMLRSYHYAAYAGLFTFTQDRADSAADFAALEPWAELWRQWVSATYLSAYRRTMRGRGIVPDDAVQFAELLDAFMLEKAFYELSYELNNRPTWVRIPLRGIIDLTSDHTTDHTTDRAAAGAEVRP
jgi:maltose alpha-D-glucosyltransferase/alpha-amylase